MTRHLGKLSLLVPEYDAGIAHYVGDLGFELLEDTPLSPTKRWVVIRPEGGGVALILARAATPEQKAAIGQQGGGRVWLFLESDSFDADYARMKTAGIQFEEDPRQEPYGKVAVFRDAFGNRWDLLETKPA